MPYAVYSKDGGFKACKKGATKCFSKKPLPKARAEAQVKALYASENVKESLQFESLFAKFIQS